MPMLIHGGYYICAEATICYSSQQQRWQWWRQQQQLAVAAAASGSSSITHALYTKFGVFNFCYFMIALPLLCSFNAQKQPGCGPVQNCQFLLTGSSWCIRARSTECAWLNYLLDILNYLQVSAELCTGLFYSSLPVHSLT